MKPVTCPDCGAVNTDQDTTCGRCGYALKERSHREDWRANRRKQKRRFDDEDGNDDE